MPIKIIIVDDHAIVRKGMRMFIEADKGFVICGEAESATQAIDLIVNCNPDIVTVDLSLNGETSGLDLIKSIKKRFPEVRTLVISMHDESLFAERALRAGAKGYIMKKTAHANIVSAIHKVLNGGLYLSESINDKIIERLVQHPTADSDNPMDILADKELEIFHLIAEGYSSKEIATKLNVSRNTIESHKRNIKEKLNLKSSQELIRYSERWSMERKI